MQPTDQVLIGFLRRQREEGMALAEQSDCLDLMAVDDGPAPRRYLARFGCTGLVRTQQGEIVTADDFLIGIAFPNDYLRRLNPFEVLTWLGPSNVFHPNISDRAPFICLGRLAPGTGLVEILYQCFDLITYRKATVREDDALNRDACCWARRNLDRFPIDPRPLKRRPVQFSIEPIEVA